MRITTELLQDHGACTDQRELFEATFPDGVTVTEAVCVKYATVFDFEWAAGALLSSSQQAVYDATVKPARDAYDATVKPARDAYEAAVQSAEDAYEAAGGPTRAAYDATVKPARDAYEAGIALAFARAATL